jgi:hypothetical protein
MIRSRVRLSSIRSLRSTLLGQFDDRLFDPGATEEPTPVAAGVVDVEPSGLGASPPVAAPRNMPHTPSVVRPPALSSGHAASLINRNATAR